MGIRPNGQALPTVAYDTPSQQFGPVLSALDTAGSHAGGAVADIASTADSANTATIILAEQNKALLEALSGKSADAAKVTADLERLNAQLQEHGEAAPGGLIPAYIEANTRRWELQEQVDQVQNDAIFAQAEAQRRRPRPVFAEFKEYKNTYRDPEGFVEIRPYSAGDRGFQFWCLGVWTGEIIVRASALPAFGSKVLDATRIQVTPSNRYFVGTPGAIDMSYVMLDMTIFPD